MPKYHALMYYKFRLLRRVPGLLALLFVPLYAVYADEAENASNPLAKASNTDIRWQHLDGSDFSLDDLFIDGAMMATDNLKIKYELHYWDLDAGGSSDSGLSSAVLKAIYFPVEGKSENYRYRVAVGVDWILDLADEGSALGVGADQIAPFAGVALANSKGTSLIPLVQHFISYNGEDISTTAFRVIGMQPLPHGMWLKLDAKVPIEWENGNAMPASAEIQLGRHINRWVSLYADVLAGIGSDRLFDWGVGAGLRFKY